MKNETLMWTIGGVIIALIALFAMSRGGSNSSAGGGGGGGISASNLVNEVNNANNNAAQVQEAIIGAQSQYATTASNNAAGIFGDLTGAAENELATIENAKTTRFVSQNNLIGTEYTANENALTAQAALTAQQAENASNNALALEEANIYKDIAHFESDNAVTTARINHSVGLGQIFQSLIGGASQFFSSTTGAKVLGVGG